MVRHTRAPRCGYLDFLVKRGLLTRDAAERLRRTLPASESWIGRLMVSHGLIGPQHVDEILNRQDMYGGLFGENAVALGYLSPSQLSALLVAQEARRNLEICESLAIAHDRDLRELLALMAEYMSAAATPATDCTDVAAEPAVA